MGIDLRQELANIYFQKACLKLENLNDLKIVAFERLASHFPLLIQSKSYPLLLISCAASKSLAATELATLMQSSLKTSYFSVLLGAAKGSYKSKPCECCPRRGGYQVKSK
jgi:hypothetical protein